MRIDFRRNRFNPTWVLIGINVVVFIVTLINPNLVYYYFGLSPAYLQSHPWTIITNIFVHSGWWHLIFNMITLYFFGNLLSSIIGNKRYLIIYFIGGIIGGIFYCLIASLMGLNNFVVGASGAIFALGGALVILRTNMQVYVFPIPVPIPMWVAIIGGFFLVSFLSGIAWQAHLGGMIAGLVGGYIIKRSGRYYY